MEEVNFDYTRKEKTWDIKGNIGKHWNGYSSYYKCS